MGLKVSSIGIFETPSGDPINPFSAFISLKDLDAPGSSCNVYLTLHDDDNISKHQSMLNLARDALVYNLDIDCTYHIEQDPRYPNDSTITIQVLDEIVIVNSQL